MIQVNEAEALIQRHFTGWGHERIGIESAHGRVLAEDVVSDRDYPPYDRVTMDGFAFNSKLQNKLQVIQDIQFAGEAPKTLNGEGVIEVMTGSSLPGNTDCVVQYEKCSIVKDKNGQRSVQTEATLREYLNVHTKGSDAKKGDVLLKPGLRLNSQHIAVAASVGQNMLLVERLPKVLLIGTGNELVENKAPQPFQIRPSNTISLASLLYKNGIQFKRLHLPDSPAQIEKALSAEIDEYDLILFSGGVSMGKADHIPSILENLGVQKVFHRIAQKPGKPLWFGHKKSQLFFGLPGNPVSTSVCFVRYVLTILVPGSKTRVPLGHDFKRTRDLTLFIPVEMRMNNDFMEAHEIKTNGSGDFISTAKASGVVELPLEKDLYLRGEYVSYYRF